VQAENKPEYKMPCYPVGRLIRKYEIIYGQKCSLYFKSIQHNAGFIAFSGIFYEGTSLSTIAICLRLIAIVNHPGIYPVNNLPFADTK
jgi:hypothetical protein